MDFTNSGSKQVTGWLLYYSEGVELTLEDYEKLVDQLKEYEEKNNYNGNWEILITVYKKVNRDIAPYGVSSKNLITTMRCKLVEAEYNYKSVIKRIKSSMGVKNAVYKKS